jgi:parallel beta-helix repeat protein
LQDCFGNTLRNNTLVNNQFNFGLSSSNIANYFNDIDASNTVNANPIRYWINESRLTVPSNTGFVALINCTDITVQNLHLTDNYDGMLLAYTQNSKVTNNTFTSNYEGIILDNSSNNLLKRNVMNNNTFNFDVKHILPNNIDTSNLVNGKSIYYWAGKHGLTIPSDAGYVALINCTEITVENLHLFSNGQGVLLSGTQNSTIVSNSIDNQINGVELEESSNNSISQNMISGILESGISFKFSNANTASGNVISNSENAILLSGSSNNNISRNNIATNNYGLLLENNTSINSTENAISGNTLSVNLYGVGIDFSSQNNSFYCNDFLNNTQQVGNVLSSYFVGGVIYRCFEWADEFLGQWSCGQLLERLHRGRRKPRRHWRLFLHGNWNGPR